MGSLQLLAAAASASCPGAARTTEARAAAVAITVGRPGAEPAYGTGFVWDDRGHIVTNHHVASYGPDITVASAAGERRRAVVVGWSQADDVALLRVEGRPWPRLRPGDPYQLVPGAPVAALGNPYGRGLTALHGRVSGFDRTISTGLAALDGMLESALALQPGDSGGPLVDCSGGVIGLNTAVAHGTDGAPRGFAIPIDRLGPVVAALSGTGAGAAASSAPPPQLGVTVVPTGTGTLLIHQVYPGTPAAAAGALPGDLITHANGRAAATVQDLQRAVGETARSRPVSLRILRWGVPYEMAIALGAR